MIKKIQAIKPDLMLIANMPVPEANKELKKILKNIFPNNSWSVTRSEKSQSGKWLDQNGEHITRIRTGFADIEGLDRPTKYYQSAKMDEKVLEMLRFLKKFNPVRIYKYYSPTNN